MLDIKPRSKKRTGRFGSLADLFTNSSLMSAFPNSGRLIVVNIGKMRVRFRPEADVAVTWLLSDQRKSAIASSTKATYSSV